MIEKALGLIALDIDGTITTDMQDIPEEVIEYFTRLHESGWGFVFITGRTFDFGFRVLKKLPFNYFYAVQNGALLFEMPSQNICSKKYLDKSILLPIEKICESEPTDLVVFAGFEYENNCYFRPRLFSQDIQQYLKNRAEAFHETWTVLNTFEELPINDFPSVKCFGEYISAKRIADKIESQLNLHAPLIKDPFDEKYYVVQITREDVNKGQVITKLKSMFQYKGKIIAAGDDLNDITMFEKANITIAMETAPDILKNKANIIARSAGNMGIIDGLKAAIEMVKNDK